MVVESKPGALNLLGKHSATGTQAQTPRAVLILTLPLLLKSDFPLSFCMSVGDTSHQMSCDFP